MGRPRKIQIVECKITAFSKKGNGVGVASRENGTQVPVEVPFTTPGDIVRASLQKKSSGVYRAKLEEIITPSPDRITPRCVHFGVCGGCRLQHISYKKQLENKEAFVRKCFADLINPDVDFRPIVECDSQWYYRNKMEFSFSSDLAGNKYLGLIIDSSKMRVLNLTECHLANSWFMDGLNATKQWWDESNLAAYKATKDFGSLRTITFREGKRTGDRMVILTVSGNADYAIHKNQLSNFVALIRKAVEPANPESRLSIFLRIQQISSGMATNFYEMLLYGPDHIREVLYTEVNSEKKPFIFNVSPASFFQTNTAQAERLYSLALQLAAISKDAVVYDFYCGTGTLGICVSKYVKQVLGVELSPEAALDARFNAKQNDCQNITIISGAARHMLNQIHEQKRFPHPDVIMIDPPRLGLDSEALDNLIELNPPIILYISCNPVSQAANIATLIKNGYRLTVMQPIDQFPQTYHVENIAILYSGNSQTNETA